MADKAMRVKNVIHLLMEDNKIDRKLKPKKRKKENFFLKRKKSLTCFEF